MQKHLVAVLLFALAGLNARAGTVTGKVTDEQGAAVPFVSVYIEGTTNGTTTNLDGDYQLAVPDGYHIVVFRYVGFKTTAKGIDVAGNTKLDCQLARVVYQLGEVMIDGNEDPAYRIMRLARSKRKFYEEQIDEYSCRVYIKGVNYVKNLPKKILGRAIEVDGLDASRSGIAYLSESVSEFHYKRPKFTKERVIASKVAGNSQGFTWNNATSLNFNIYEKSFNLEGLSGRDLISPLHPSATLYYRYVYKGFFMEDSIIVNRIGLVPRTTGIPLFHGDIFIQEHTWRIHGTDLYMTKESGIDFVDTIRMKVEFVPVAPDLWMQSNLTFDLKFNVKLVKVSGWGSFSAVFSNYNVRSFKRDNTAKRTNISEEEIQAQKDEPKAKSEGTSSATKNKKQKDDLAKMREAAGDTTLKFDFKNFEKGPLVKVESEANTKDSTFWETVRVIPLTEVEQKGYALKDSLEVVRSSPAYIDSIDRKRNQFNWQNLFLGYRYYNTKKNLTVSIPAPLGAVSFNTVEGYVIDLGPTVSYAQKKERWAFSGSANLRYGIASQTFYGKGRLFYRFNARNRMSISAEGGHYVHQFDNEAIPDWINALYTLFFEQNYMRLYRHTFGKLGWGREIVTGLRVDASLYFGQRAQLYNATNLSGQFVDWDRWSFLPNTPAGQATTGAAMQNANAMIFGLSVRWKPGQKYLEFPDRTINLGSKWPTFKLLYRRGIPLGATSDFDYLDLTIEDDHRLGMLGTLEWRAEAGIFASNNNIHFADFKHFATSEAHIQRPELGAYLALPYYLASTNQYYAAAHLEHHFKGFILNKVPLIKKLKWDFLAIGHYLYTPSYGHYWEVGVGLENIFKILRVDVAFPFRAEMPQPIAVRVRIGI